MQIKPFLIFTISLISLCHSLDAQRNNLLYELNFEENSELDQWSKESCCNHSLVLSDSIKRNGNFSGRFEVRASDPTVHNGKRSEIATTTAFSGYERWYGMSTFFPGNFVSDHTPEIVIQWHDYPDFDLGETWRSPPIAIQIQNDSLYVKLIWASAKVNSSQTESGRKTINLGPVKRNTWTDWVFHIKFSYSSDALLEIWQNQKQVLAYTGPNSYNDTVYPYLKFGDYKWPWLNPKSGSTVSKRVVFFDAIRVGSHCATYSDVAP